MKKMSPQEQTAAASQTQAADLILQKEQDPWQLKRLQKTGRCGFTSHLRNKAYEMRNLLSCCMFLFSICAFAQTPSLGEKFYVEPERIHIEHHEIFVDFEGSFLPVSMISVGERGVYAVNDGVHMAICPVCEMPFDLDSINTYCSALC